VDTGRVDYRGLLLNQDKLLEYLAGLSEVSEKLFASFSRQQQLALLINAYNGFTLALILENYPVASIQDIEGNWTETRWRLLGQDYSLNQIENQIIRPRFDEPRIHFALVCAARGCPPLRSEAYTATKLEAQLAAAARSFARDRNFNRLDTASGTLYVSKIFEWYQSDFAELGGEIELPAEGDLAPGLRGVIGFFISHLEPGEAEFLKSKAVKTSYLDYDWRLNAQVKD
jgi:hypothetical protein